MNENQKKTHGKGRIPKSDPAVYRYSVSFNEQDHARFLALFERSGMRTKAHFIVARIFETPFRVETIDRGAVDYYTRLTNFFAQFRGVAVNYNQVVKALNTNFAEKKALAFLYKLEKATIELAEIHRQVVALTKDLAMKIYGSEKATEQKTME